MSKFRKEKDCPSSFLLADSLHGTISGEDGLRIATHLVSCDFCSSELEFYKMYLPDTGDIPAPPIPQALLELAEALIGKEKIHISRLESLLRDAA